MPATVTIVYRFLPQYRFDFFKGLERRLESEGIHLRLVYGQTSQDKEEFLIDWAEPVRNKVFRLGSQALHWQPLPKNVDESDLVVLMQENKLLSNYPLLLKRRLRKAPVALWGHGTNFQDTGRNLSNRFKAM